ncbi:MAG: MATE family efflux transporter [Coriobacteriia bacterium]|nr:MATE family efflux transporter [Coriobacteriia bacterium]
MDKHFSKFNLVIYSLPAIAMMIAVSAYSFVNGFFLSNYAGPTAFAAENLIWPLIMIFSTVGLMVGTGSSALIANKLGEKDKGTARRYFSMFVYFAIILGIVLTFVCFVLVEPVAILLGAKGELLDLSIYYEHIMSFSIPGYLLQMAFMVYLILQANLIWAFSQQLFAQ